MKRIVAILAGFLLSACTTPQETLRLNTQYRAPGQEPRIKLVVIHYTVDNFTDSLALLTGRQVSAHYLIGDEPLKAEALPPILQLVPEQQLAWHAGSSFWRGATRLNDTSVGIELVNPGYQQRLTGVSWASFSSPQIDILTLLLRDIIRRYNIAPYNIVGHSDIAAQRKQDPGPRFPWQQLAEQGIGAWPEPQRVAFWLRGRQPDEKVPTERLLSLLARYGYEVTSEQTKEEQRRVIMAFQMHFRPADYRGYADAQTESIACALLEKYEL